MVMPPASKKLREYIGLGPSICLSIHPFITPFVCFKTSEPLELGTWNFINTYLHFFFFADSDSTSPPPPPPPKKKKKKKKQL